MPRLHKRNMLPRNMLRWCKRGLRRSGVDHTVLPANTQHLPLPRSSPEGATTVIVIAPADETYYILINRPRVWNWDFHSLKFEDRSVN